MSADRENIRDYNQIPQHRDGEDRGMRSGRGGDGVTIAGGTIDAILVRFGREDSMTTFDLAEVRTFTDGLKARRQRCDRAEGTECAFLDGTLRSYASICCEFCEQIRQWGRAVFYGRVAFDPQVEALWLAVGRDLHQRASELWAYGKEMEGFCFELEGGAPLGATLWQLERLLTTWATPQRATAPLARHGISADAAGEAQRRVDALPPLPAEWQPIDARQGRLFRKLAGRRP